MPRPSKVHYRKDRDFYYCQIDGKQINLGKKQQEAYRRFNALMAARAQFAPGEDPEVFKLGKRFLAQCEKDCRPNVHRFYRIYVDSFIDSLESGLCVSLVKKNHVTRWLNQRYPKSGNSISTCYNAIRCVQRMFNWAVDEGIIPQTPIPRIKKEKPAPRTVELTREQYKEIIDAIKDEAFRDFVEVMRHTGARPEEVRKVSAKEFDRRGKVWRFKAGFTAKTKEDRQIPLNDRAFEICRKWADRFPEGPMFRNTRGDIWRKQALIDRCARLREKLGFHFIPYSFRHVFCVEALENGVDSVVLARLMGHSDLTMIQKVYGQIQRRGEAMRNAMIQATSHLVPDTPVPTQ